MKRINVFSVKQIKESSGMYDVSTTEVTSPENAYKIINSVLGLSNEPVEVFGIISLTTKNKVAGLHIISRGTLSSAVVHARDVFQAAILNNAASVVLFHNHPSGDPKPSEYDRTLTNRLVEAGQLLGIPVLDHVILGHDGAFISFKGQGII